MSNLIAFIILILAVILGTAANSFIEFSNTTPLPAKIYANEGVAQFVFIKGNEKPAVSYAKRKGKYMRQRGVTLPKI